jgi:hypothetical protein
MSWEAVRSETRKCWCGKGTITDVLEMDDWNRTRDYRKFDCPACEKKHSEEAAALKRREEKKENLYRKAQKIAEDRYLTDWLSRYEGLSKKEAWMRYTGGSGYPSLGTFYKHVKHAGGIIEYMRWRFSSDFPAALRSMAVKDPDIQALLAQRESR